MPKRPVVLSTAAIYELLPGLQPRPVDEDSFLLVGEFISKDRYLLLRISDFSDLLLHFLAEMAELLRIAGDLSASESLKEVLVDLHRQSLRAFFEFRRGEVVFESAMCADEGIGQRLNAVVVLEIETPVIRQGDDGIDIDLKGTDDVPEQRLVFRIGDAFVDGEFDLFSCPFALSNDLVADVVLLLGKGMLDVGVVSLFLAVDAANVLVDSSTAWLLLDVVL
jgi:hypothetical protein